MPQAGEPFMARAHFRFLPTLNKMVPADYSREIGAPVVASPLPPGPLQGENPWRLGIALLSSPSFQNWHRFDHWLGSRKPNRPLLRLTGSTKALSFC